MNTTTAFTPLESLFLFESVIDHGISEASFDQISATLQTNGYITDDERYDATRLSSESLQGHFLQLMQEELRNEEATNNGDSAAGGLSPNNKRRRQQSSSASLSTLRDALIHARLVPPMVGKLYKRYENDQISAIRADEARFFQLQAEIKELEEAELEEARLREESLRAAGQGRAATVAESQNAGLPNGTSPATATASTAEKVKSSPSPLLPAPAAAPVFTSTSQGLMPPGVTPSGKLGPLPSGSQNRESPRRSPAPVLQPPQSVPGVPPRPGLSMPRSFTPEALQRPDTGTKPKLPPSQQPVAPAPGTLKWEPPYQPSVPPLSRATPATAQYPPQRPQPSTWNAQVPIHETGQQAQQHAPGAPQSPLQVPQLASPRAPHGIQPGPPPPGHVATRPIPESVGVPQQQPPSTSYPLPTQSQPAQQLPPRERSLGEGHNAPPTTASSAFPPAAPLPAALAPRGVSPVGMSYPAHHTPMPHAGSIQPAPVTQGQRQPMYASYNPATLQAVLQTLQPQRLSTPTPPPGLRPRPSLPQTPISTAHSFQAPRGSGTKWTSVDPTPSTPRPDAGDLPSPAVEPLSPPLGRLELPAPSSQVQSRRQQPKQVHKIDTSVARGRGRPRGGRGSHRALSTQSPSTAAHDELQGSSSSLAIIKREELTPKPPDETGDTTADESGASHRHMTPSGRSRPAKRKRADSVAMQSLEMALPNPPSPPPPPTHVLWTRGFPKISASALDQIGSHRYANMFAHKIRDRDAPGYSSIVRHPVDLKSVRMAISQGNKAAVAAMALLPEVDTSASSVWLPISEDLVPPRGIINSAQLDCELVHMFANAIMYNPDTYHGPGPAFMAFEKPALDGAEAANASLIGYKVDEDGVVKEARAMYSEVEKLLNEMRSAERQRGPAPPLPPGAVGMGLGVSTRQASVAGGAGDVTDHAATEDDGDEAPAAAVAAAAEGSGTAKRRRIARG